MAQSEFRILIFPMQESSGFRSYLTWQCLQFDYRNTDILMAREHKLPKGSQHAYGVRYTTEQIPKIGEIRAI